MRKLVITAFSLIGAFSALPASGQSTGTLSVSGTSTVKAWTCTSTQFEVKVMPATAAAAKVLAGEKAVDAVAGTFPVASLDCRNGTMNEHMRNTLKAKANPAVLFELLSYDIERASPGATVQARGKLTIAGSTQPVEMKVMVTEAPGGGLRFRGEREILLTAFGMKPPSLMMGTMKVGDKVKVSYDIVIAR
jgi:polyisoprenoid-binding protein YceI